MELRKKTYEGFEKQLLEKIASLRVQAEELQQSIASETKSSVGDKFETGRAMLHLEQEKLEFHIREAADQLLLLHTLERPPLSTVVSNGSLVATNRGYFFISGALGKINIDNTTIMAISALSPLGKSLIGHSINETIEVNKTLYTILSLY